MLQMSLPYLFLYENDKDYLYVYYGDAEISTNWESNNENVATVKDGVVTAKSAGHALITATAEDGTQVTSLVIVSKSSISEDKESPKTETPVTKQPVTTQNTTNKPNSSNSTSNTTIVKKPKKVSSVKVKKTGKKKLKVSWKQITGQDGYEVQYALNKSFTKSKKTKKYGRKTHDVTLKGLKSKKTYYVRVRAYKKNGTKNVYGSWSVVKKTKVK